MNNKSKKTFAEALVLANRIEATLNNNEALGRALLTFQNDFNTRTLEVPVDENENINYSGNLIEMFLENNREISVMNNELRNNLVMIGNELLTV